MEEHKNPLQRWFSQHVTLEDVRQAEREPLHHELSATPDQPPVGEKWRIPRQHYRAYAIAGGVASLIIIIIWSLSSLYLSKINLGSRSLSTTVSDQALAKELDSQIATYKLTIERPDKTRKQYTLHKMGLTLNKDATIKAIRQQQAHFAQRLKWWQPIKASLVLNKNTEALNNFIAAEVNITIQPSQDAVLAIESGQIKITDAVAGKQYGLMRPRTDLTAAVSSLQTSPIKLRTLIVNPALTAHVLEPYKGILEKTINQPVSFSIGSRTVTSSPADIANWLEITPNDKSRKVNIAVNSGKVQEYIDAIVRNDVHPPKAQIAVRQQDGSARVLVAGINGSDITNKKDTATSVANSLLDGKGISTTLSVSYQAFQTITTDSYDKWIEVDLTNKRMYAYEHDNLVRTVLVTAGAPATPTVTGQYAIYAKYAVQDMRGQNVDGSNYYQPNVKWINYFYRDYAIHGNYWRPLSYFGNVNSSHGCVSSVDSEAQWIYEWAPIGTPVIVHT